MIDIRAFHESIIDYLVEAIDALDQSTSYTGVMANGARVATACEIIGVTAVPAKYLPNFMSQLTGIAEKVGLKDAPVCYVHEPISKLVGVLKMRAEQEALRVAEVTAEAHRQAESVLPEK